MTSKEEQIYRKCVAIGEEGDHHWRVKFIKEVLNSFPEVKKEIAEWLSYSLG